MPLLNKLLARLPAAARRLTSSHANPQELHSSISNTINEALASAGLLNATAAAPSMPASRGPALEPETAAPAAVAGTFLEHSFSNEAGTRRYKVYVPACYDAQAQDRYPLLLMLHGCTQSPDDFAAGTRMNALADQHGFLVAYPAQSANANGSKCWNWFRPGDQGRATGEPALLAGLTQQLIRQYAVDPQRVFVAGLSAGAAMAVILGATYPDLYAAVGAHSGLPYRAARDMGSAFAAMGGNPAPPDAGTGTDTQAAAVVPLIVFHGDADSTVAPANGQALVKQAVAAAGKSLPQTQSERVGGNGRSATRSVYTTALGKPLVEYWQIHGAGHAWSGGSTAGSYTDP
ncbi:MAG: PHB depolymerase family esterase, partial [Pseudoxanthomonas sp.]